VLLTVVAASACGDGPDRLSLPSSVNVVAEKFWEVTASTRWNERALGLLAQRPPATNGQTGTLRILTYLSLAQYRAVLAADDGKAGSTHPSLPAAVGGASVAVLSGFFPLDIAALEAQLDADLAATPWPGATREDPVSGEAIGRAIGAAVLAYAAGDNYLATSPGVPPVGPGFWVSSGAPITRGLYRARPFFMTSGDQLRSPPPPAFGSAQFLAALAEVRAISDTRTPEQTALAQFWSPGAAPFNSGALNRLAAELIGEHQRTEREAARILAYANAAAFDAQIACFDTKYAYWFIRPPQADPAITTVLPLQNNPSYTGGHSCATSAIMGVLADAFPSERGRLEALVDEAGLSQLYSGIQFRFDIEAGQTTGRAAAALALAGDLRSSVSNGQVPAFNIGPPITPIWAQLTLVGNLLTSANYQLNVFLAQGPPIIPGNPVFPADQNVLDFYLKANGVLDKVSGVGPPITPQTTDALQAILGAANTTLLLLTPCEGCAPLAPSLLYVQITEQAQHTIQVASGLLPF
jgi:hypothetical protein